MALGHCWCDLGAWCLRVQLSLIPLGGPRGQQLFEFPIVDDEANMALVVRARHSPRCRTPQQRL